MRKLLYFSGFALLLAACSPDPEIPDVPGNGGKDPTKDLAITATIADDTLVFRSGDGIGIFVTREDGGQYGDIGGNIKAQYDNGWKSASAMPLSGEPARIYAYYPFVAGATAKAVPVLTDGKTPVLYGSADKNASLNDNAASIKMGHALSVVGFNFVKKDYYGAGRLEKVEILNGPGKAVLASRGTLDCTTGIITPIPEDTAKVVKDCKLTQYDEYSNIRLGLLKFPLIRSIAEDIPGKGNTQYLRVLPMVVKNDGDIIYRFTIDGVAYTCPVKAGIEWKQGETHIYDFSLEGVSVDFNTCFSEIIFAGPGDEELSHRYDFVTFPEEAKPAILQAMKIWAQCLDIKVPIKMKVGFAPLNGAAAVAPVGSSYIGENRDLRYTDALLNQIVGYDYNPYSTEMIIVFNPNTWWYFGLDGKYQENMFDESWGEATTDLLSTTLHEMCHSFGFSSTIHPNMNEEIGTKALPQPLDMDIFGSFMVDGQGRSLKDYPNNSKELYDVLVSGQIAFAGPNAVQANGGKPVLMDDNKPNPAWNTSHLGGFNIMASGEYHHPGTIIMAMMQDIGWKIKPLPIVREIK